MLWFTSHMSHEVRFIPTSCTVIHFEFSVGSGLGAITSAARKKLPEFKWFTFGKSTPVAPNSPLAQPIRHSTPFDISRTGPTLKFSNDDYPTVLRVFLHLFHNPSIAVRTALDILVEETNRYAAQRIAAKRVKRGASVSNALEPSPATNCHVHGRPG